MDDITSHILSGVVGGLIGGFVSHRFAFGRDIHREWRIVRDPVLKLLADEAAAPSGNVVDLSELRWRINQPWRSLFDRLATSYETAVNDQGNREFRDWAVHYKDPSKVQDAAGWLRFVLHWM